VHETTRFGNYNKKRSDWPAGEDPQQIVSWTFFHQYWKKYNAHIIIRRATHDICDDCYVFYNQVKYKGNTIASPFVDVDSTDDDSNNNDDSNDEEIDDAAPIKLAWQSETTIHEGDTFKLMISAAYMHVKKARNMRSMLVGKADLALQWTNKVNDATEITDNHWHDAVDCLVGNYCQNLALPYMGEHQPGGICYFSSLMINCFGIANVGLPKAQLNAYIYHEGEGTKGGNNVASLIMKHLDEEAWIN
jgi:hypothetical protein